MTVDIDMAEVERLEATVEADAPVFVLNLLRFRETAEYPAGVAPVGGTGREAYFNGYLPAFGAIAAELGVVGIKPVWIGGVAGAIVGAPDERWDAVAIVEYPRMTSFRQIVGTDAYRTRAEPMRRAALAEWRLIAQTKMAMPG